MPSFTCDHCQETLKKAQLEKHAMKCRPPCFSCIDCYKTFRGNDYKAHTSCITEVEKYHEKKITHAPNNSGNAKSAAEAKISKAQKDEGSTFKYSGIEKDLNKLFEGKDTPMSLKDIRKALEKKHSEKVVKKFMQETWSINPLKGEFKIIRD